MDLSSPSRKRSGTGLTAGVLFQKRIPNDVEVEKLDDSAGFLAAQSYEILRVGVSF